MQFAGRNVFSTGATKGEKKKGGKKEEEKKEGGKGEWLVGLLPFSGGNSGETDRPPYWTPWQFSVSP